MSAVRTLVLGVVHSRGQAHGYQVRRELLSWRADRWARVGPGSIYSALRTLAKHGLLTEAATEPGAGGPERTVYAMTPDGETEFLHLVRVAVTDPATGTEALNAAFAFLHLLPRREVAELLDHRARALRARLVAADPAGAAAEAGTPSQVAELFGLQEAVVRAELDWCVDLADRVRRGEHDFPDTH